MTKGKLPGKGIIDAVSDGITNNAKIDDLDFFREPSYDFIQDAIHDIARMADSISYDRNTALSDVSDLLLLKSEQYSTENLFDYLNTFGQSSFEVHNNSNIHFHRAVLVIGRVALTASGIKHKADEIAKANNFKPDTYLQYVAAMLYAFASISDISKLPVDKAE